MRDPVPDPVDGVGDDLRPAHHRPEREHQEPRSREVADDAVPTGSGAGRAADPAASAGGSQRLLEVPGGGAELTPAGTAVVRRYRAIEEAAGKAAARHIEALQAEIDGA